MTLYNIWLKLSFLSSFLVQEVSSIIHPYMYEVELVLKIYSRKTGHYKCLKRRIVSCFTRPHSIAPAQKYNKTNVQLCSSQENDRSARLNPDPKIWRRNVLKAKMMFVTGNKKESGWKEEIQMIVCERPVQQQTDGQTDSWPGGGNHHHIWNAWVIRIPKI